MRAKKILSDESGQSTMEFALTLILLMAVVLFYLQLSLILSYGNYVHYATFMAARAYLSSGPDKGDQEGRAREVLVRMLSRGEGGGAERFAFIAKGVGEGDPRGAKIGDGEQFDEDDRGLSWMQGVRYSFRSKLFVLPLGRTRLNPAANALTLTSESWLGREPTFGECKKVMEEMGNVEFDNGC